MSTDRKFLLWTSGILTVLILLLASTPDAPPFNLLNAAVAVGLDTLILYGLFCLVRLAYRAIKGGGNV